MGAILNLKIDFHISVLFAIKQLSSQLLSIQSGLLTLCVPLQCKAAYQSLLIADQHCRTQKYLLCLASGVPCVSHIWVRDCCKDNKLLNYRNYLLPAGVGPDDSIVEW